MGEGVNNFRDLRIWQLAIELVKKVYAVTTRFPKEELYGLVSQMRRSAVSIPSNVAEGFRRQHNNEFRQFLYISLGSCAELETQTCIAKELKYIDEKTERGLIEDIGHICGMIVNLAKKL